MRSDEGVPHDQSDHDEFGKDVDYNHEPSLSDDASSKHSIQAGVKRIEAVSKAWTKTSLIVAYVTSVHPGLPHQALILTRLSVFYLSPMSHPLRAKLRAS
jgi:hypothetical protein